MRGSEIHRIRDCSNINQARFNEIYKSVKPLIRNLASQVNPKRFGCSPDVIYSYFLDKFTFVFQKYNDLDDNRLKGMIISSLRMYKNKLVRINYNEDSDFNNGLVSLDLLYSCSSDSDDEEDDDRVIDEIADEPDSNYMRDMLFDYMEKHLTEDEFLLFKTQIDPPDWLAPKSGGRITNIALIEFFDLPRDRKSYKIISAMRSRIDKVLEAAKIDLN